MLAIVTVVIFLFAMSLVIDLPVWTAICCLAIFTNFFRSKYFRYV